MDSSGQKISRAGLSPPVAAPAVQPTAHTPAAAQALKSPAAQGAAPPGVGMMAGTRILYCRNGVTLSDKLLTAHAHCLQDARAAQAELSGLASGLKSGG